MGEHSFPSSNSVISSNHDLLASVTGSTIHQAKEATTHHYHKSFRGFSAILTPEQAQKLEGTPPSLATNILKDVYSIGSFYAFKNNILVSASAGNSRTTVGGHISNGDVGNGAPWVLTVAASSINRELSSFVGLGNSTKSLRGTGVNPINMDKYYGIILAEDAVADHVLPENAKGVSSTCLISIFCYEDSLNETLITDKIVVCAAATPDYVKESRIVKSLVVEIGGGVGMILHDPYIGNDLGFQHTIPTAVLGTKEMKILYKYTKSERNPTATIYGTRTVIHKIIKAPKMDAFSSKGPNFIASDIIKPDITAPGVNILAAWSPKAVTLITQESFNYMFSSGTSMSCPHVSAVAAIIKSHHPDWSPAAIKSTIMTTAYNVRMDDTSKGISDPNGHLATPFDYGSGHINPAAALDPGLVYDYDTSDIIKFLCSSGVSQLGVSACKDPTVATYDLNYPSIGVANFNGNISVSRAVTYVGHGPAVFTATWDMTPGAGVEVIVEPKELKFREAGEKMAFKVYFVPLKTSYEANFSMFGSLTWKDGNKYKVRSPIGLNVAPLLYPL
ncbi:hypothetical protein MKX03_028585 [Papaver bracteatum]|nr:hypothetical protein MKX03_028585 [Papaver bracteatum]